MRGPACSSQIRNWFLYRSGVLRSTSFELLVVHFLEEITKDWTNSVLRCLSLYAPSFKLESCHSDPLKIVDLLTYLVMHSELWKLTGCQFQLRTYKFVGDQ